MKSTRLPSLILSVLILSSTAEAQIDEISKCGRLVDFHGCWILEPFEGSNWYLLETPGAFQEDDFIRVAGPTEPCNVECGPVHVYDRVVAPAITPCEPESLGCGVLTDGAGPWCSQWLWTSPVWGRLLLPPPSEYVPGDTVLAVGYVCRTCGTICSIGEGTLLQPTLSSCVTPVSVRAATWGLLKSRYR